MIYDYSGNLIFFYIINELEKLIDSSKDKFVKTTFTFFILDIIIQLHQLYDKSLYYSNIELLRFAHILNLVGEREGKEISGDTENFYKEIRDQERSPEEELTEEAKEELEDAREAADALDMEETLDYEVDYLVGVNASG